MAVPEAVDNLRPKACFKTSTDLVQFFPILTYLEADK